MHDPFRAHRILDHQHRHDRDLRAGFSGDLAMKPPGPKEAALQAMREARFEAQKKVEKGIRDAARAGKAILEEKVAATSERMKNKPAKKRKRK